MNIIGRVLQLIRAVRAGSLIKHIEQAVERGLCAGIRVAANRTQCAVDRVEQLVGRGERFGSGVDQLGALVDGGRGDRGQLVERLGQCRNLGQLLVDAAECGVGEFGQLFALGSEVLSQTLVIVEYVADVVQIVEHITGGSQEIVKGAAQAGQIAAHILQRITEIRAVILHGVQCAVNTVIAVIGNEAVAFQVFQYILYITDCRHNIGRNTADRVAEVIQIVAQCLEVFLHIGDIFLQAVDIQPLRTRLIVQIVHQVFKVAQRGLDVLEKCLILSDIRAGLLKRIENAVRSRVQLNERVLGVVQLRNQ